MPGMDYSMVSTGPSAETGPSEAGFVNGGMAQREEPFTAPTVVVDVDDIDAALEKIEGLGGSTVLARHRRSARWASRRTSATPRATSSGSGRHARA